MSCILCGDNLELNICELCFNKTKQYFLSIKDKYLNNSPYPHIEVNNLFSPEHLNEILTQWPRASANSDLKCDTYQPRKHTWDLDPQTPGASLPEGFIKKFLLVLTSQKMLDLLSSLTGINDLISDTKYYGAGLHEILPGGKLRVHTDFRRMRKNSPLFRRLNLLIYLNHNWKEKYNGYFEMFDKNAKYCVKKIPPLFNKTVIFSTTATSWHGHPQKLKCPDEHSRKSIAVYYYSKNPGEQELEDKPVQWKKNFLEQLKYSIKHKFLK